MKYTVFNQMFFWTCHSAALHAISILSVSKGKVRLPGSSNVTEKLDGGRDAKGAHNTIIRRYNINLERHDELTDES